MKLALILLQVSCIVLLSLKPVSAQVQSTKKDEAGYITKYDSLFNGIGPEVYFLPPPRSKVDILFEEFHKTLSFQDTLNNAIRYQDLIDTFTPTFNTLFVHDFIKNNNINLSNWPAFVTNLKERDQDDEAIGLLNEIAKKYIIDQNLSKAESVLLEGMHIAENKKSSSNKLILQNNLISLYLYNKNYNQAKHITEELIKETKKSKSDKDQGTKFINLARLQALIGQYKTAENTILRKALPIFNKNKDYEHKIQALISLAQIYIQNSKYPEAQWFLIQAQEIAEKKNIPTYNSTIEYLLGSSKFYQSNFIVSKKELTKAYNLAQKYGDKHLQLAASQLLAGVNIELKNTEEAEFFLKSYWNLRNELF